jgi:predicted tellurium resistance membrane protein TerC
MLLLALVLLEAVLSADNAVALASLVQHIEPHNERERILNLGLIMALVLRAIAVVAAGLVVHQPVLRFLGGAYLVWLALAHFQAELSDDVGPQTRSFFSCSVSAGWSADKKV